MVGAAQVACGRTVTAHRRRANQYTGTRPTSHGRRGANQYDGSQPPTSHSASTDVRAALSGELEAAAWAFNPAGDEWRALGFASLDDVNAWWASVPNPVNQDPLNLARMWFSKAYLDSRALIERERYVGFVDLGPMSLAEALDWRQSAGLPSIESYMWRAGGLTPIQAGIWSDGGFGFVGGPVSHREFGDPVSAEAAWSDAGFADRERDDWLRLGCNLAQSTGWCDLLIAEGITPEAARDAFRNVTWNCVDITIPNESEARVIAANL